MLPNILYVEDDPSDAYRFAEVILKLCEPSRNTQSLDNTQEIRYTLLASRLHTAAFGQKEVQYDKARDA